MCKWQWIKIHGCRCGFEYQILTSQPMPMLVRIFGVYCYNTPIITKCDLVLLQNTNYWLQRFVNNVYDEFHPQSLCIIMMWGRTQYTRCVLSWCAAWTQHTGCVLSWCGGMDSTHSLCIIMMWGHGLNTHAVHYHDVGHGLNRKYEIKVQFQVSA